MKTLNFLMILLFLGTASMQAQKEMMLMEPDGFTTDSPIDVTTDYSYNEIPYSAVGINLGDYITKLVYKGYNPGKELTRHLKVTLSFNPHQEFVVCEGDYIIPNGGTADACIPLLDLTFKEPVKANVHTFNLKVECTGAKSDQPVYFESYQRNTKKLPVATLTYESEKVSFYGMVRNQDGEPVANAQLNAYRYNNETNSKDNESKDVTDADGSYSLTIDAPYSGYQMTVTADGYADYVINSLSEMNDITLYNRLDFTTGTMATLILPEAPNPSWGRFYRLDRKEDNIIFFERENEPKANFPYVIFPDRDFSIGLSDYDLRNLPEPGYVPFPDIYNDPRPWGFYGSYQSANITPFAVGSLRVLDSTSDCDAGKNGKEPRIGAFRAYLQVAGDPAFLYEAPKYYFAGEPTGISDAVRQSDNSNVVYDLQGRQLKKQPRKGVYIRDGRKVVVK